MKIALFVHCFLPKHFYGTEVYTYQVARSLRERGYDVAVITANFQDEPPLEKLVTYYEYDGLPVYCIDKTKLHYKSIKDTYYQEEMSEVLRDILVELKPDLVHVTHLMNHTAILLDVISELKIPTLATLTDFFGICYTSQLQAADSSLCHGPNLNRTNCIACRLRDISKFTNGNWFYRLPAKHPWSMFSAAILHHIWRHPRFKDTEIETTVRDIKDRPGILGSLYANYRAVIAPTRFLADAYAANGLSVPIHVSHFGVDTSRAPKPHRNSSYPVKLAFIGQIYPHKGADILINAFSRLPSGSAELSVYGKEDQSPEYTERLKRMAEGQAIQFKGTFPQSEIDTVLKDVDFLVIPSRWYENSPLVLLNALSSHTPVIVSNVAGMTEFVEDGKNGYVFERGSVDDLERVLRRIVNDPEGARKLSVTTEYHRTTSVMVDELVALYDEVLSTQGE